MNKKISGQKFTKYCKHSKQNDNLSLQLLKCYFASIHY
jgi:hypothetical protein